MASDENTANPIVFGMRWCSWSALASGRPRRNRFTVSIAIEPAYTVTIGADATGGRLARRRGRVRQGGHGARRDAREVGPHRGRHRQEPHRVPTAAVELR